MQEKQNAQEPRQGFNAQGFVTKWLYAGPTETPYTPPITGKDCPDQLAYEKQLRSALCEGKRPQPVLSARCGEDAPLEQPWRYWYRHGGWFLDESTFYSSLTDVRCCMAVCLNSRREMTVPAVLWTYASVTLWVNGEQAACVPTPVYKPIARTAFSLHLKEGENFVSLYVRNLGVRDTRTIAGLQLTETNGVTADVPGGAPQCASAAAWLDTLRAEDGCIVAQITPPCKAVLSGGRQEISFDAPRVACPPQGSVMTVRCETPFGTLSRMLELTERACTGNPGAVEAGIVQHRAEFLQKLAQRMSLKRDGIVNFSMFHVLARLACGGMLPDDPQRLLYDLALIDRRIDCADFLITGLIRLLHCYEDALPAEFLARARETLCAFRYWMDEEGADGMCFWSENHALMFYAAQMLVGALYPQETFTNSGLTGAALQEIGTRRCREWLEEAKRTGLEEFNSAGYTLVTVAALLNLIDYAPQDIADEATALVDRVLLQLSRHVFHGTAISPQGRVYRDAIYPFAQSVQSMLGFLYSEFPGAMEDEGMWNVFFATSRYTPPADIPARATQDYHGDYTTGNARIVLHKTQDWLLTSVCSPRADSDAPQWENLCFDAAAKRDTNLYVKSLNERFHGTTVFEPGVYGYQQHMWYAALSADCVVFTTHPGSPVDMDGMRPGYWHGNGVMPALRQQEGTLLAVYDIPPEHPLTFTHVYWPTRRMDETCRKDGWLFGRCGESYVGLWCSGMLQPYDDVLTDCEYRYYAVQAAYVCRCGGKAEYGAFADFINVCLMQQPTFVPEQKTLTAGGQVLTFERHENKTQYI